jgi:DNA polymerase-3 subunit delta'
MSIYPWQDQAWTRLLALRGRLPHALLIHGPRGIGKRDLALALAEWLLCSDPAPRHACGQCQSCRWFAQGSHPDFLLLDPDAGGAEEAEGATPEDGERGRKSRQIKVETIRDLGDFVTLSAHGDGWKVALVHPAEAMNPAAANALLKTLEEPPANVLLILVSHQLQKLLPTIRSRCMKLPMPVPARSGSLGWLADQGTRDAEALLALAGGAPLEARRLGEDGAAGAARSTFLEILSANPSPTAAAEALQDLDPPELVRWLQMWVHDLLAEKQGLPIRYHPRSQTLLSRLGRASATGSLLALLRVLNESQRFAQHPLNKQLLLEKLMLAYNHAIQTPR